MPVLVALLYDPVDAHVVVVWIVVYQQIENYFLSPRLTARTMDLSAPVAFAAALIGGALGGILFAFLALPAAGVIQAAFRAYGRDYEVVEDDTVAPALTPEETAPDRGSRPRWLGGETTVPPRRWTPSARHGRHPARHYGGHPAQHRGRPPARRQVTGRGIGSASASPPAPLHTATTAGARLVAQLPACLAMASATTSPPQVGGRGERRRSDERWARGG